MELEPWVRDVLHLLVRVHRRVRHLVLEPHLTHPDAVRASRLSESPLS